MARELGGQIIYKKPVLEIADWSLGGNNKHEFAATEPGAATYARGSADPGSATEAIKGKGHAEASTADAMNMVGAGVGAGAGAVLGGPIGAVIGGGLGSMADISGDTMVAPVTSATADAMDVLDINPANAAFNGAYKGSRDNPKDRLGGAFAGAKQNYFQSPMVKAATSNPEATGAIAGEALGPEITPFATGAARYGQQQSQPTMAQPAVADDATTTTAKPDSLSTTSGKIGGGLLGGLGGSAIGSAAGTAVGGPIGGVVGGIGGGLLGGPMGAKEGGKLASSDDHDSSCSDPLKAYLARKKQSPAPEASNNGLMLEAATGPKKVPDEEPLECPGCNDAPCSCGS